MKKDSLYIISIIQSILKNENIQSNREEIYQMLLSDKSYPSILSIINTLKIWGINCNAYQADYKSLVENEGYKIADETVEIFRQQLKDINELRLKYLPLVSFNGRKLPWNYQISDLNFYL
jgi:hypothetical protein